MAADSQRTTLLSSMAGTCSNGLSELHTD